MRSRVLRRPSSTTGRAPCRRTGAPRSLWVATAALIALATVVVPARPAEAAGMTTHSWMAVTAIDQVADANLPGGPESVDAHLVVVGAVISVENR